MKYPKLLLQKLNEIWSGKHRSPIAVIVTAGGVSLLSYMVFAILPLFIPGGDFSHFPPYMALPDGGFDLENYYLLYLLIGINALLLFGMYFLSLKAVATLRDDAGAVLQPEHRRPWRNDRMTYYIFGITAVFHLVMLATPFLLSTDIFDYIRHGRIFALYGENPLIVPATYFPHDPFFPMGGWVNTGSVYGPLHVYVTGALAWLSGNGIGTNILVFKSFFIILNLANVALIGMIAARLRPGLEKKAMLFYGWNPFILTLVVANAHNDIFMLAFVLLGILCYVENRLLSGAFFIMLATLVKFIALPILLVYIALVIRRQKSFGRRVFMGIGTAAATVLPAVVSYAPLWEGRDTFNYLITVGQKTNFTVAGMLRDVAAGHLQLSLSNTIVQLSLVALLVGFTFWHVFGVKDADGLLSAAAGIAFLAPLALFWFQPWYLTLALGLLALRPWRLMYRAALLFSFTVMFFDSFWWHAPMSMNVEEPLRVLVVFGPPIALLAVLKGREALPTLYRRLMAWSHQGLGARQAAGQAVCDPGVRRLVFELGTLLAAALVPMALIVSNSPHLKDFVSLIAMKLKLLTRL